MDTRKDLLKLYHPRGQAPKEVATASDVVMDALYWNGSPAGSYTKALERYRYNLPPGIIVYGDDGNDVFRYKGGDSLLNPSCDVYDGSAGVVWTKLRGCQSIDLNAVTTVEIISNGAEGHTEVTTSSYDGTVGGGLWIKSTKTSTPSQSPSDRGSATLTDPDGYIWNFSDETLNPEQLGGIMSGKFDNSLVTKAVLDWSASVGGVVNFSNGVYLTEHIYITDGDFHATGSGNTEIKSAPEGSTPAHAIQYTGNGHFSLKNLTINHDRDNKTLGHGIGIGGSLSSVLDNLRIVNSKEYGIGVQAGTNTGAVWTNIYIDGAGRDGVDIKDHNYNNGTFKVDNITVRNHAIDRETNAAFDCRGQVELSNATFYLNDNAYGLRTRGLGTVSQGRGGGVIGDNFKIIATQTGTNCIGVDFAGDTAEVITDFSNIVVSGVALALRTQVNSTGKITNFEAVGIHTGDSVSLSGTGWGINNMSVSTTGVANRVVDFESTADSITINGFSFYNGAGSVNAVRIVPGAVDITLANGTISSGTIGDGGTNTTITNVT